MSLPIPSIPNQPSSPSTEGIEDRAPLLVNDLVEVLRRIAAAYSNPRIGNPAVGAALLGISRTLTRYKDRKVEDVIPNLTWKPLKNQKSKRVSQAGTLSNVEVVSLNLHGVKGLLAKEALSKADLVYLGTTRFGLSKAALQRMGEAAARDAIETAARNEESTDIISRQASKTGAQFR